MTYAQQSAVTLSLKAWLSNSSAAFAAWPPAVEPTLATSCTDDCAEVHQPDLVNERAKVGLRQPKKQQAGRDKMQVHSRCERVYFSEQRVAQGCRPQSEFVAKP